MDKDTHNNILKKIKEAKEKNSSELYLNTFGTSITLPIEINELTNLKSLWMQDLSLEDISFLQYMPNLEVLRIIITNLVEVDILGNNQNLKELTIIFDTPINNLSFLSKLTKLETLQIAIINKSNQSYNISSLNTKIQSININFKLDNYDFISEYEDLKKLKLSPTHTDNLNFIRNLKELNYLFLDNLENCFKKTEFKNLLNQINSIESIIPHLDKLSDINLEYFWLKNFDFLLSKKQTLTHLNLSKNRITEINIIMEFKNLIKLDLSFNRLNSFNKKILIELVKLEELNLVGNPIKNIPKEIFSNTGNVLQNIRNYFEALEKGSQKVYQSKVIFIGNGRVGKTCMVKRWLDDSFYEEEKSTHAIQLRREFLAQNKVQSWGLDYVQLHIWDFGGQDIYHATHRLFMQTQAIFVLVWDWENEPEQNSTQIEVLKNGQNLSYQNYSLLYWLSYANSMSKNNPIIIAQTKKEKHRNKRMTDKTYEAIKAKGYNVEFVEVDAAISDKDENGFLVFESKLNLLLKKQIQESCVDFPANWWKVQLAIQELQEKEIKQISLQDFLDLCEENDVKNSEKRTLLDYFHNTGLVFFKENLFKNQIIIDQKWAIEAVYALFNRNKIFTKLLNRGNGIFTGEDLQDSWDKTYTIPEQKLILSFMTSCEICVELNRNYNKLLTEREFLAPQLLPDTEIPNQQEFLPSKTGLFIQFQHTLLHSAIIQRFIVRTLQYAKHENIRRNRIFLELPEGKALIQGFPSENKIVIQINSQTENITNLIQKIRNEFTEIQGIENITESVSVNGEDFILLNDLNKHPRENRQIRATNGNFVDVKGLFVFLGKNENIRFEKKENIMNKIFISYCSADRDLRQIMEQSLKIYLKSTKNKFDAIWTDKEIQIGDDWNSTIQDALDSSTIGILLVSPMFLGSDYCMADELKKMLDRRKSEGYLIIPILIRECNFFNDDNLKAMQFFKTYQSEYDITDLLRKNKLMPFDELADVPNPQERLLNRYFQKLANDIDVAVTKQLAKNT